MQRYAGGVMSEDLRQWVVRGVEDELARQFVDRAARQRRTTGEVLNGVLRAYLERPEGQGAPPDQGAAGDLAALVTAISATVDAHTEAIHVLFEHHQRQDFPAIVERLERLEASQVPPAIPSLPSGDGDKGRVPAAIPGHLGSPLDAVEPVGGVEVPEMTETHPGASGAVSEMDVIGEGTRRRFTPTGAAKVEVLLRAGVGDAEIAGMFGMDRGGIRQRRKKLEAKYGPGLGVLPLELARQAGEMLKAGRPLVEIAETLKNRLPSEGSGT
jgi:hypothetical protein